MRPPCELVVRYVLPAFRSLVAKELIEEYNFSQTAAAKKLGTTQAAISYYLYSKRGDKRIKQLESIPLVQSAAGKVAREIATTEFSVIDAISVFCELCVALRKQEVICDLHKDVISTLNACDICSNMSMK